MVGCVRRSGGQEEGPISGKISRKGGVPVTLREVISLITECPHWFLRKQINMFSSMPHAALLWPVSAGGRVSDGFRPTC